MKFIRNLLTISTLLFFSGCQTKSPETKIALFLPITHRALEDIAEGFESAFYQNCPERCRVDVFNALGNTQLLQAQIEQARDQDYDLFVPVGTLTTQLTISLCPKKSILSLAGDRKSLDVNQDKTSLYVVQDEVPIQAHLELLRHFRPRLKKLTLVYSPSDKIFPQVQEFVSLAKQNSIAVQLLLIQNTQDLFRVGASIAQDTELLFVLKDHAVVCGIEALALVAKENEIPLVTSDEGSVKKGALFALGVKESEIGRAGGILAAKILKGIASTKEVTFNDASVFLHPDAAQENDTLNRLKTSGYRVEVVK